MTAESIANAIIAALSAGLAAGGTDATKKAVIDAYDGFKGLIKKKFGKGNPVEEAIEKLEAKPESDGRKQMLIEELRAVNAESDSQLASAVESLLELIRTLPGGERHVQSATGSVIAQADRNSTATVTIFVPPRKDG